MKRLCHTIIIFVLIYSASIHAQILGGGGEAYPNLKTNVKALTAWQDMKFGLFIHWGPASLRGTEIGWSRGREVPIPEYDNLYREFNPVLFDTHEWVNIAKKAGMKYLVITTKHHDGFCIWDSDYTDYDIMSSPFKRDILKELADECRQQGILFGTYYSIADWHHPHYTTRYGGDPRPVEESDMGIYVEYLKNQIKELVENYDTNILWFDGYWEDAWTHQYGMDLYKYIRGLKDYILINNRVDRGRSDENGMTESLAFAGDFGTPEQKIGTYHPDEPWESCITICRNWSWIPNDHMKSLRECIHTLALTAGGGGNLLLNVGPMPDGRIEQRQIQRLEEIGKWLEINGESIYGTEAGPFKPTDWMVSTQKDNKIFVHLLKWPEEKLVLPGLNGHNIISVKILQDGQKLRFKHLENETIIFLPPVKVDENNTVIILEMDKKASLIPPVDVPLNKFAGLQGSHIYLKNPFSTKYPANGTETLRDEIRASANYTDGKWLGFEQVDFEVIVDLTYAKSLKKIGVGCLQDQYDWIFFPESVQVLASDDNENYRLAGEIAAKPSVKDGTLKSNDFFVFPDNLKARYIKIIAKNAGTCPEWHKGAGGKAWLFVDEVIVE